MFGISFPELLIIILAAFLIIGPERMTANAYRIGKWVSIIKRELTHLKETHLTDVDVSSFYEAKTELNKSLTEIQSPPNQNDAKS